MDCHNPHITKSETPVNKYNQVCLNCHTSPKNECSAKEADRMEKENSCVACHMREGLSRDIPHVRIHDHKITIPPTAEELQKERIFKGLFSVNNPQTDNLTKARGYLLEYETYHPDKNFLDSAAVYLEKTNNKGHKYYFNALINLYFLKKDHDAIVAMAEQKGIRYFLDSMLVVQDYSNYDAWTTYRIGQAYENKGNSLISGYFYDKAIELAPYNLEFRNKYGILLVKKGELNKAREHFRFIIDEDPNYTSAYVNLGYLLASQNQLNRAEEFYLKALSLDPDHVQALLNLSAVYYYQSKNKQAKELIDRVLIIEPDNQRARMLNIR